MREQNRGMVAVEQKIASSASLACAPKVDGLVARRPLSNPRILSGSRFVY